MTSYALIAAIEGDKNNLNTQLNTTEFDRLYETEALLCFRAWRQNGGWLKDIPIYAMCPTHNTVSENTQRQLRELGIQYIEEYQDITSSFTSGFLNIPLVGAVLEDRLSEDVFIKIDLDMNLIQPLPPDLVNSQMLICGQYDDYCTKQQRGGTSYNPFDTGFIISRRESGFYKFWFEQVVTLLNNPTSDPDWIEVRSQTGEYYLEEYIIDRTYLAKSWPIQPVQKYQIGEWYTPVAQFTDEELRHVYFWHEHVNPDPKYNKIREKVEYFNRMRKISA